MRWRRAAGPAWSFPSHVYCDGVPLVAGRPLPWGYLQDQLQFRGYARAKAPLARPGTYAEVPGGAEIYLRGFADSPAPEDRSGPERVRLSITGGRIARIERLGGARGAAPADRARAPRIEPAPIAIIGDEHRVLRTWVPLARIPRVAQQAVVAAEDRRFRRHLGLDLRSNLRAMVANVRAGGVRQGASTITQQVARALFLSRERRWGRKAAEAGLALAIEATLSKDQILEIYLNSVYWGQSEFGGIAGMEEAARYYFSEPVDSLDLGQAALLAGIIPAPNTYSPFRNPRLARARRDAVLADMVQAGVLSAREAARQKQRPLRLRRGPPPPDGFPSFIGLVREELSRRLPRGAAENWGLTILTTLDPVWQARAESTLAENVAATEQRIGIRHDPLEGAFVAMDPATGAVRAVVAGRSPVPGGFNRATQGLRQPGSAFKPVVYAAALDPSRPGRRFTPASTVPDLQRSYRTPEGDWSPRNDENDYHDQVTLAKALAKSLNIATVNLTEAVGPDEVARYARRFGLGRIAPVVSVGLGTNEVTLMGLTDAYATFPNGGLRREPTSIRQAVDARGRGLLPRESAATRVIPEPGAALMTGLLEDVVIFGISAPLRKVYGFTRPTGGKTGTTNDYNDAWFVGFTPDVAAGVWIGYDTPASLGRPAAEIALPVWAGVMGSLLQGFPPTPFPALADLVTVWIDPWSGGVAGPGCPSIMRVSFLKGTEPREPCRTDHAAEAAARLEAAAADSAAVAPDSGAVTAPDSLPGPP